jgi:hypothetical protein
MLPFGAQSTQVHLNYWEKDDYNNFKKFILKNNNKIINFDKCIKMINNNFLSKVINFSTEVAIKGIRIFR